MVVRVRHRAVTAGYAEGFHQRVPLRTLFLASCVCRPLEQIGTTGPEDAASVADDSQEKRKKEYVRSPTIVFERAYNMYPP